MRIMFYDHYMHPSIWTTFVGFGAFGSLFFIIAAVWLLVVIALKGYALWHAAKRNETWWFVALLIVNTLGILELVYIFFFLKKRPGKSDAPHAHHQNHSEHTHHSA
jgi:NADH:ubiquinone oxidoreductase subunit 6 (subunit J)